jgi:hypothetical protein
MSVLFGNHSFRLIGVPCRSFSSKFCLWIDGKLIGVYSRSRDAIRRYRQLLRSSDWWKTEQPNGMRLPAFIETKSGDSVKFLSGIGFTTKTSDCTNRFYV